MEVDAIVIYQTEVSELDGLRHGNESVVCVPATP
jgi:hypothetical protein